jgi:hypothetical protein
VANKEQLGSDTQTQQQKAIFIFDVFVIKELNSKLIVEN